MQLPLHIRADLLLPLLRFKTGDERSERLIEKRIDRLDQRVVGVEPASVGLVDELGFLVGRIVSLTLSLLDPSRRSSPKSCLWAA